MKLEHVALNVEYPVEMAQWYVNNLGMKIVSSQETAPFTHFLADDSGRIMIEIYCNPANEVPPYRSMNALLVHLAFVSENPDNDKDRLLKAGATFDNEVRMDNGTLLIMMRDPWGVAIQLCKRAKPMLLDKEA
jgi:catechol 2,3-dioxygenase-like lactoylglutathione lyase family enzyme